MGSLYSMWILSYKMFKNKTSEKEKEEEEKGGRGKLAFVLSTLWESGHSFLKHKRWKLKKKSYSDILTLFDISMYKIVNFLT